MSIYLNATAHEHTSMDDLPNEVVRMIYEHMSSKQRHAIFRVCKIWHFLLTTAPALPLSESEAIAQKNVDFLMPKLNAYLFQKPDDPILFKLFFTKEGNLGCINFQKGWIMPPRIDFNELSYSCVWLSIHEKKETLNIGKNSEDPTKKQPFVVKKFGSDYSPELYAILNIMYEQLNLLQVNNCSVLLALSNDRHLYLQYDKEPFGEI